MYRTTLTAAVLTATLAFPALAAPEGMKEKLSGSSVEDTVEAFKAVLDKKGATVFATIEHAKGAEKVGMTLKPTTLVLFGNPKLGTPLMHLSQTMGIDLPLKALFYENESGKTTILYPDIEMIAAGHGIDADDASVQKVKKALEGLTSAVAK